MGVIKTYIDLNCSKCGKPFKKENKEYHRRVKMGKTDFFCGLKCLYGDKSKFRDKKYVPFHLMMNRARYGSKRKGWDFDLTVEYLYSLWEKQKGICPYTKIKMVLQGSQLKNEDVPNTASVDRIDYKKGYVMGNVELVCVAVNLAKSCFSKDCMLEFFNQIILANRNVC
jgi:hypothetical protein